MLIHSEADMITFGRNFAAELSAGAVIELIGDVGAGKTTFTRGLGEGLGIEEPISSPSFTISRFYQGEKFTLTHYDFYRLDDPGLMADDLAESIDEPNNITVIEWGESIADILPEEHYRIAIRYIDENTREVTVE
ncbi:tRNA (adenosine(37)-N6)-threonylcarbamoyltransferase complex ATPase subunit type 1 TsaE [Candidatus Saccharibacteria bacterium]|nr:tRNA (adenosine(37)-N6)-threonylcarbamoyltransferase complex ATPase subunit type 1 TsaE [Candidatus Saccharibacteria bacterium]